MIKITLKSLALLYFAMVFIALAGNEFNKNSMYGQSPTTSILSGGLLDPSKFTISNSYSMSYSSDNTNKSWDGLYLSSLKYKFSIPVTLSLDLGFAHQPGAFFKTGPVDNNLKSGSFVVPHASLTYKPFDNTILSVQYYNYSNVSNPYLLDNDFNSSSLFTKPQIKQ